MPREHIDSPNGSTAWQIFLLNFTRTMDKTTKNASYLFCFWYDILVVSKGNEVGLEKLVKTVVKILDEKKIYH